MSKGLNEAAAEVWSISKEGFMILKENMKWNELDSLVNKCVNEKEAMKIFEFLDQEFSTLEEFRLTTGSMYTKGKTSFYSKSSENSKS